MKRITIITEKKNVADPIAEAMGWRPGKGGYVGTFEGKEVTLVWARGHLMQLVTPEELNPELGWNNPLALAPLPRNVPQRPTEEPGIEENRTLKYRLKIIGQSLRESDEVIMATDPDREGEYIGWSVLEHLKWNKPVRRLWLDQGTDDISVKQAFSKILPADAKRALARAAEARDRCDYSYMYIVRLMTFYGRQGLLGANLGSGRGRESVVSLGRVQTASLYMIYMREMDLRNFVPKTFYKIAGDFLPKGVSMTAQYAPKVTKDIIEAYPEGVTWEPQGLEGENKLDRPLFTGQKEVKAFYQRLRDHADKAIVLTYTEGTKLQNPPITFDLVAAKSALADACKINNDVAQTVIEDLYEQGYISYPRTAHGELPVNMYQPGERDARLACLQGISSLSSAAKRAQDIHNDADQDYKAFMPKVFVKKKLEHHGLVPSPRKVNDQILSQIRPVKRTKNKVVHTSEHMKTAYLLIAKQFVQAMLPPVKLATQKIDFRVPVQDILGHPHADFTARAERTVDAGWRAIMNAGGDKNGELPRLKNGEGAPLSKISINEGKTKPPPRYNEKNWETAMQNAAREVQDPQLRKYMADGSNKPAGIGTPATRMTIVPTLKARNYISANKQGQYFLENKGEDLINYLISNGHHQMYRIETTAEWEGRLSDIAILEDDSKAQALKNEFVEQNLCDLDAFINSINSKYSSQVVDRISGPFELSEAQRNFLAKVEEAAGVKATEEQRKDRNLIKAFIDKHKGSLARQPPSEKMVKFARDLAAKLPEDKQPDPRVFTESAACRAFLDEQMGKAKKGTGKATAKSSSRSTGKAPARKSAPRKTASKSPSR